IVSDLRLMTHVFGHHNAERALDDLQRVTKEHQQLLNALRKGNAEKAREVLVSHLRMGCERALRAYDRGRLEGDDRQQSGLTYPEALREQIHALERDAEPAPSGRRKKRAP